MKQETVQKLQQHMFIGGIPGKEVQRALNPIGRFLFSNQGRQYGRQ
jgi:hypothetical protein